MPPSSLTNNLLTGAKLARLVSEEATATHQQFKGKGERKKKQSPKILILQLLQMADFSRDET